MEKQEQWREELAYINYAGFWQCLPYPRNNMAFAFTLLGIIKDKGVNYHADWVFCIQEKLLHLIGLLWPDQGDPLLYAQCYIYDAQLH
jgi:hypothetical protein